MTERPLRIAIGVHGRFHAFDLARALTAQGHDVTVFTNYPVRIAARFGLPPERIRSFVVHGVAARAAAWLTARTRLPNPEAFLHRAFGRWLARSVSRASFDVVHVFSGVAEETIEACERTGTPVVLCRGSAHIHVQDRILQEEVVRTGVESHRPSPWMIAREEREYANAAGIIVLSRFAERTFLENGYPADQLRVSTLGVDVGMFAATAAAIDAREARIRRGDPLRILYVGLKSAQKGMADLTTVAEACAGHGFVLRAVGAEVDETGEILGPPIESRPPVLQHHLPDEYAWADVFLFPTLQDGFAAVVAQASMAGLPVITTENCGAADFLVEGETGWIVPIRRPDLIVARVDALSEDRDELARIARHVAETAHPPSWEDAAAEFERAVADFLPPRGHPRAGRRISAGVDV